MWNDEPAICFHSTRVPGLVLASHDPSGWTLRTLATGADVGRDCALVADGPRLRVVYRQLGVLKVGEITPADFTPIALDAASGFVYGQDLAVVSDAAGQLVIAHHDGQGSLRLTWEQAGGFRSSVAHAGSPAAGVRPTLSLGADGTVFIEHGGLTPRLDADGDAGLYETFGLLGGPFVTDRLPVDALGGGQAALMTAAGRVLFARERQRSALFGAWDALWYFSERQGLAGGRDAGAGDARDGPARLRASSGDPRSVRAAGLRLRRHARGLGLRARHGADLPVSPGRHRRGRHPRRRRAGRGDRSAAGGHGRRRRPRRRGGAPARDGSDGARRLRAHARGLRRPGQRLRRRGRRGARPRLLPRRRPHA